MQALKRSGLKGKSLMDQMVAEGLIKSGKSAEAPAATPVEAAPAAPSGGLSSYYK
jgi:hypothetical protein